MAIAKEPRSAYNLEVSSGVDDFPREFLALIGIDVQWRHVPTDIDPEPYCGFAYRVQIEQETNE